MLRNLWGVRPEGGGGGLVSNEKSQSEESASMSDGEVGTNLPAAIEQRVEAGRNGKGMCVTGLKSDGESEGILELAVPNLLPTDNADEVVEQRIRRVKIPVRIMQASVHVVDNGWVVKLPQAGRQGIYGPDGAMHVFTDKAKMLEFVGLVIGQVTYQYREHEVEADHGPQTEDAGPGEVI